MTSSPLGQALSARVEPSGSAWHVSRHLSSGRFGGQGSMSWEFSQLVQVAMVVSTPESLGSQRAGVLDISKLCPPNQESREAKL